MKRKMSVEDYWRRFDVCFCDMERSGKEKAKAKESSVAM